MFRQDLSVYCMNSALGRRAGDVSIMHFLPDSWVGAILCRQRAGLAGWAEADRDGCRFILRQGCVPSLRGDGLFRTPGGWSTRRLGAKRSEGQAVAEGVR